jgi:hypothetical protein
MERSDWLQRCLVRKLGAASDFLGANIRIPNQSLNRHYFNLKANLDKLLFRP